jgi:uncharacterized cupin superfamily protein
MATRKHARVLTAADRTAESERRFSHPFNPRSEISGFTLGDPVGLTRIGVHLTKIPPGKESFVYHRHHSEEEFVYILSGRGVAEIDGEEVEVSAGDFIGYPAGTAHHLRNAGEGDLVYLSGGERREMEIADFPRQGKRMVRVGGRISVHSLEAEALGPMPKLE